MGNITKDGKVEYSNLVYSDNESEIIEYQLKKGDILFNRTNSSEWVGKSALYDGELGAIYAGYLVRVRPIMILSEYLILVMTSSYYRNWCHLVKTDAVNQSNINAQKLKSFMLPLPPLKEQRRIYDNFLKLSVLVKNISDSCNKLSDMINLTKNKILDLAMQGKLVPQDPADEPGAYMLRRINPKAKIITDNPHSWNIPNGWCWVMVSDVFAPMQRKLPEGDNFWYIDIDSVDNKRNVAYPKNICTTTAPSRASRFTQKGDVVFSMVRPYLRNIALVPEDDCIASTGFYVFHPLDAILSKYSYILTLSSFFVDGLNSFMKGDNSPSINKNNVESFVIPLPPLNEQKRIVAKIEDLYSVLDEIEASLRS